MLTVTQQRPLLVQLSCSNTGKMLLAFRTMLSRAETRVEQLDSPKISCLLRPFQGTTFFIVKLRFILFIQCMHHFICVEFHLPFYYQVT